MLSHATDRGRAGGEDTRPAGATVAVIEIADDGALRLEIRDDGAGFDERAASRSPLGPRRRPTGRALTDLPWPDQAAGASPAVTGGLTLRSCSPT